MVELLIHIPDDQAAALERVSHERRITREQVVEQAVTQYLAPELLGPERKPHPLDFFGALPSFAEDGLAYQERIRAEWVREWDPEWKSDEQQ